MQCPSCKADIKDPEASFCARCGTALGSPEGDATSKLRTDGSFTRGDGPENPSPGGGSAQEQSRDPGDGAWGGTQQTDRGDLRESGAPGTGVTPETGVAPDPETARAPSGQGAAAPDTGEPAPSTEQTSETMDHEGAERSRDPGAMVEELAGGLKQAVISGGWPQAAMAAAAGFVAVLAAGAVLITIAKLFEPAFGSGQDPFWVLQRIVLLGLASLGVPIGGGSVLPVSLLIGIGMVVARAARDNVRRSGAVSDRERALEGARVAVPFAIFCFVAALLFRAGRVSAGPGAALLLGFIWGAIFGAWGGLSAEKPLRARPAALMKRLRQRTRQVYDGLIAAGTMLATAAILSATAVLLYLIITLASGDLSVTASGALALLLLLVVFAPNLIVGMFGFALGAPITVMLSSLGSDLTASTSLIGWGGGGAPWYAHLLLIIPLLSCMFGGFAAQRRVEQGSSPVTVLGAAAATFAVVACILVYLSGVALGRASLGRGNAFQVAPDATAALILGFAWAAATGFVGWRIGAAQGDRAGRASADARTSRGT